MKWLFCYGSLTNRDLVREINPEQKDLYIPTVVTDLKRGWYHKDGTLLSFKEKRL